MTSGLLFAVPSLPCTSNAVFGNRTAVGVGKKSFEHGWLEGVVVTLAEVKSGERGIVLNGIVTSQVDEGKCAVFADEWLDHRGENMSKETRAIARDDQGGFET